MEDIEKDLQDVYEENRVYELGYLLVSSIPEENVNTVYGDLKEVISSLGGLAISDEMPRMIMLAYPMTKIIANVRHKFSNAYFGWVKFEMSSEKVLELKKKLDLDPNFIRFLIVKTVKENTVAAKRFVHRDSIRRKTPSIRKEGEESAMPINKEEIDKEIEALIAQ